MTCIRCGSPMHLARDHDEVTASTRIEPNWADESFTSILPAVSPGPIDPKAFLAEVTAAVEKVKRDYPDPPMCWELADDIYTRLRDMLPVKALATGPVPGFDAIFGRGTPVVCAPWRRAGEWGPVFRMGGM